MSPPSQSLAARLPQAAGVIAILAAGVALAGAALMVIGNEQGMLFAAGGGGIAIIATAWVWSQRRGVTLGPKELEAVAAELNLRFDGQQAAGTIDGFRVTVTSAPNSRGESGLAVTASFEHELDLGLNLRGARARRDPRPPIAIDDPVFNAHFVVLADEPKRARELLTDRVREFLVRDPTTCVDDFGVRLWLPGSDRTRSKSALRHAISVAKRVSEAALTVPCARALRTAREHWLQEANEQQLLFFDTPFVVKGVTQGIRVKAHAVRDAFDHFHYELSAQFPEPLGVGLAVRPLSKTMRYDRQGDTLGDAKFDQNFDAGTDTFAVLAAILDATSRERFVQLRAAGLQLRADDRGVWAWVGLNPKEEAIVPSAFMEVALVASRIQNNTTRWRRRSEGPPVSERPPPSA